MGCTLASGKSSHKSDHKKNKGSACVSESQDMCLASLIPKVHYPSSIYYFNTKEAPDKGSTKKPQSALFDLSCFRYSQPCLGISREERITLLKAELQQAADKRLKSRRDLAQERQGCPYFLFCKYIDNNVELNLSKENVFEAKALAQNPHARLETRFQENQVEISQVFRESGPTRTASLGFCRCLPNKALELNTSDFPDYQIFGDDVGI